MREPYMMKVVRTVLGGGKPEMVDLSRQTLCSFTIVSYVTNEKPEFSLEGSR